MIFLFQLPCGRWWTPQACGILHAVEPLKLFSSISLQTHNQFPQWSWKMEVTSCTNQCAVSSCSVLVASLLSKMAQSVQISPYALTTVFFIICYKFSYLLTCWRIPFFQYFILLWLYFLCCFFFFFFSWSSFKFSCTSLLAWLDIFGL